MDDIEIGKRLDAVEEFFQKTIDRHELRELLKDIYDLERLVGKISLAVANARDLISLNKSLSLLPKILEHLKPFSTQKISEIRDAWDNARDLTQLIDDAAKKTIS